MVKILDRFGRPLESSALKEPQTSALRWLHQSYATHPSRGLTPPKLASILEDAERGDLTAQSDLFEDMEEKDAHIFAEMQKRKNALHTIAWDIAPPRNPSAQEQKAAEQVKELVREIPNFEDLLFDLLDAVGKGFSCQEIEWQRLGKSWLPKCVHWRPQSWFQISLTNQNELRLRDNSAEGAALTPFGWIVHTHKAKSGYVARAGILRVLAWPYLFKNYSVRDLAEFLEIYGLPMRLGKYPNGASEQEKATLLRAVVGIGHNAAGIIPDGMAIDFVEAAKGTHDPFAAMLEWCERSESKAILGGTLTSQTDQGSGAYALGEVHNEVRHDILASDARQAASTLTRDLVFPIAMLNVPGIDPRRAPRLTFDPGQAEDLKLYSGAIPALVDVGVRVPAKWVHEKLRIPEPQDDDQVLERKSRPQPAFSEALRGIAAATATPVASERNKNDQQALADAAEQLGEKWRALVGKRIDDLIAILEETQDLALFRERLGELLLVEPTTEVIDAVARAGFASHLLGRAKQ